jgi:hypothetical protein
MESTIDCRVCDLIEHDQTVQSTTATRSRAQPPFRSRRCRWLIAFIFKDALIAALDREIDAEADDKAALTHEARQQREAEAMGDLLSIEREEAALTWSAMEQGLPVEFRPDISPLALLGLQLRTEARATEAPGTSPGLSGDYFSGGRQ